MLWVKSFHIVFMVAWFAGLFYLPRLFVYHAQATDAPSIERFKVMERKLYRGIMTPSMVVTIALGMWMLSTGAFAAGWMHAKLVLVVLLMVHHFWLGYLVGVFARGENRRTHVFYRWINELPLVLLIGIVVLVVVKPF
jgi:putative membrane protein